MGIRLAPTFAALQKWVKIELFQRVFLISGYSALGIVLTLV